MYGGMHGGMQRFTEMHGGMYRGAQIGAWICMDWCIEVY